MINELLDDRLDEPMREQLLEHLRHCDDCRARHRGAVFMANALGGQALRSPTPRSIERMWQGLEEKLDQVDAEQRASRHSRIPAPPRRRFYIAAAAAAAACVAGVVIWHEATISGGDRAADAVNMARGEISMPQEIAHLEPRGSEPTEAARTPQLTLAAGALERADGGDRRQAPVGTRLVRGEAMSVPAGALAMLERDDSIHLAFGSAASFELVRETTEVLEVELDSGWLTASVDRQEQPVHVRIMTPVGDVHVVGTVFAVEVIRDESVEVRVLRGTVRFDPVEGSAPVMVESGRAARFPEGELRQLDARRATRDEELLQGELTQEEVVEQAQPSAEELLEQAEAARRSGNARRAANLYQRVIGQGARGPEAGAALISLGQLSLGPLGQPSRARRAFERYLSSRRRSLRQEAYIGLIRSHRALGQSAAAARVTERYRAEYPNGRYRRAL